MSSTQHIKNSLRDVIPSQQEPYPPQLISYIDQLYTQSTTKIPTVKNGEVARYHICSVLAIEKLQYKYTLCEPVLTKIPAPPKIITKLVDEFKRCLFGSMSTATTPTSATKSVNKRERSTSPTPKRKRGRPPLSSSSSPLKSPTKSPLKTPSKISPLKSPSKISSLRNTPSRTIPKISSPLKTLSTTNGWTLSTPKSSKQLTTPAIIQFCNRFHIPSDITPSIVQSMANHKARFNNDWGLLCGLISIVFCIVNKSNIQSNIGTVQKFTANLHNLQMGQLSKTGMVHNIKIVESLVGCESWLKSLEKRYNSEAEKSSGTVDGDGMIVAEVCYSSKEQTKQFDIWKQKIINSFM